MATLDTEKFWENYSDLKEIVPELVEKFKISYPENLKKIKIAVDQKDPEALRISAHGLKGMLFQLYATDAGNLAAQLEAMGKLKTTDGSLELSTKLVFELKALETALNELVKASSAA
jgi:HPt (histidine-containing phosphotransfer) domain-containing protein